MSAEPLVSLSHIDIAFGRKSVLRHVNFSISPGEIVTLVGPNGSGKSTLLKAVIGAVRPQHGRLHRKSDLRIGYVPQKMHIDPTLPMTVARFLSLPNRVDAARVRAVLDQAGLSDHADQQMANLSGGQMQRVLLARAVMGAPDLLLLDEPTQGLDQPGSAAFYTRISEIRDTLGCAVLMVSHELHVVMSASDRVICLNGHICCEGRPEIVASAPEYRALFGTGTGGALALYRHEHDHHHHHHDDPDAARSSQTAAE